MSVLLYENKLVDRGVFNMCTNEHSCDCKYKESYGVQYAAWEIDDPQKGIVRCLISAQEWGVIQNYFDDNQEEAEIEYNEEEAALKVVYGTYKFQDEKIAKPSLKNISDYVRYAHIALTEKGGNMQN